MLTGHLIVAAPLLDDPNFTRTIVVVVDHDDEGALGLVLNRPTEEPVAAHVPAWIDRLARPAVVFVGGPVGPEVGMAIAEGAPEPCVGTAGLVHLTDDDPGEFGRVRVFAGYAGWSPGQLDAEVGAGAWAVVAADVEDLFHPEPRRMWRDVLARQRGPLATWATLPADPGLN